MSLTLNLDDVALRKGRPAGTIRAERADGSSVHIGHSDNWDKAGSRASFVRKVVEKLHPDPVVADGAAVDVAAAAAVERDRKRDARELEDLLGRELDAFHAEKAKLIAERDAAPPPGPRPAFQSDLPVILLDTDEHRVVAQTVAALAAEPNLYHRGGRLVRVTREWSAGDGGGAGRPVIQPMPAPSLREAMTKHAAFTQVRKVGKNEVEGPAHPPTWLVEQVHSRGEWDGIRQLVGISEVPFLRPDGTLCQTPGYDAASSVLYEPAGAFPAVHPDVGIEEAADAMAALREVVCDFRFEAPEHEAAWVAGLLTVLGRFAFAGPAPGFLLDANVRGAGKGMAVNAAATIVTGDVLPVTLYSGDYEEMRKKYTSIALAGDRMVVWDNLVGAFGGPAVDAALTSTKWKDRLLAKNENPSLPLFAVQWATGNNVVIAGDTARRLMHIRLKVLEEKPEERADFRHPDLLAWVRENRPRLLAAALTVLVAYCNAGRPATGLSPLGSFEGWSKLIRGAVVWAGLPDPALTQRSLAEQADADADLLRQLHMAWRAYDLGGYGLFVGQLIAELYPPNRDAARRGDEADAMRAVLEALTGTQPGKAPSAVQVGNRLKGFSERVLDDAYLKADGPRTKYGFRWKLLPVESGPAEGVAGEAGVAVPALYAGARGETHSTPGV